MATVHPLEDERGVDRAAIREILALSPPEGVQRLVDTVIVWTDILRYSRNERPSG